MRRQLGELVIMEKVNYKWGNVPLGGGGFVTGLIIHPADPKIKYIRTDVGGAYRWNPENEEWIPITDWLGKDKVTWYGIDGMAIDPNNKDIVYMCCGDSGRPSDVLKSYDRGETWEETGLCKNFLGNGACRDWGECIMVDPNNSDIVYCGTRWHGLYRSFDGAKTWECVESVPKGVSDVGIRVVLIDKNSGKDGRSQKIYVASAKEGLYASMNGGETFEKVEGAPISIARGCVFDDGRLIVSSTEGVFIYDGKDWKDVSPVPGLKYKGIDVDPRNNNRIVCACDINQGMSCMNLPIYFSEDCGETWRYMNDPDICKKNYTIKWWPGYYFSSDTSCIRFGLEKENDVWFTDWYGTWVTDDITADVVNWTTKIKGHEEIVAFTMISPPEGEARFITGVADNDGMRYVDIHDYPPERRPLATNGLDFCESDSNFIAAIGAIHNGAIGEMGYSEDNGITWKKMINWDDNEKGLRIAVNPKNPDNMCAMIINGTPRFTTNRGRYWHYSKGTPADMITSYWGAFGQVISDRVADGVFYVLCKQGLYRSKDCGAHFEQLEGVAGKGSVKTLPYHEGEIWYGNDEGMFRSADFGDTWEKLPRIEEAYSFDFGKGLEEGECALYIYGIIDGQLGKFRSDDYGKTFVCIDDGLPRGKAVGICADRKVYGRIYMSTGGRGFYYAEPADK